MTKRDGYELGSTIHERLDSIRMTPTEREAAEAAMHTAFIIVDACERFAHRIRHFGASVSHKPTVAH
jgi:hypothetical protein